VADLNKAVLGTVEGNAAQTFTDKAPIEGYSWYRVMAEGNAGKGGYTLPYKVTAVCGSCKTLVTKFEQAEFSQTALKMKWKGVASATQYYTSYASTAASTYAEREASKIGKYTDGCFTELEECRDTGAGFSGIATTAGYNGSKYWRIKPAFKEGKGLNSDPVLMWKAIAPAAPTLVVNRGASDKKYYATKDTV